MAVVIDNGSGIIKVGDTEKGEPSKLFPTVVGRPDGNSDNGILIGDQVIEHKEALKLNYPINHGTVENWDDMEKIWKYALGGKHKNPVLLTEAANTPNCNKQKAAEIFFEKFNTPSFYVTMQETLSLYASGRVTGIVLNSGDGVTASVPIYEGYALRHAIHRSNIAGRDVTQYLQMLLRKGGYNFHTSTDFEVVKKIKEISCYLSLDMDKDESEYTDFDPVAYQLPDNQVINIGPEKFRAPELLFEPTLMGKECDGVQNCLGNSILASDLDLRKILCTNIIVAGGSTKLKNFGDRLFTELEIMYPENKIKIYSPKTRLTSAWTGGAILASMQSFEKIWISKKEYKEGGARVLIKKCK